MKIRYHISFTRHINGRHSKPEEKRRVFSDFAAYKNYRQMMVNDGWKVSSFRQEVRK